MPFAVPLIIAGVSAAANLYGAKKGADAAKKAAAQQIASVDKAQDFTREAWEAQQKALNPYQQAGQYSLAALMARQYGGKAESYMPPQGYGPQQGAQMPQGYAPPMRQPQIGPQGYGPPQMPPQGMQGPPPMSLAAIQALQQNRGIPRGGTQNMNAGQVGMQNIPRGVI